MKNFLCIILSITLLSIPSISIAAESNEAVEIEYFDDGSYIITTIDNEPASSIAPLSNTTTKSKTAKYYSGDIAKWYVKVTGTFTYGNGTSNCTSSSVSAGSYASNWKISSKSASKSGSTATAKATAKKYYDGSVVETLTKTVKLTCSPTGTFS